MGRWWHEGRDGAGEVVVAGQVVNEEEVVEVAGWEGDQEEVLCERVGNLEERGDGDEKREKKTRLRPVK